ncbi:hypothetical protein BKA57DRAFT_444421 [Linnemannia elongata]|nr:hypothetical protein BKA57DRAFT_444421 [Linnemannia elongata]
MASSCLLGIDLPTIQSLFFVFLCSLCNSLLPSSSLHPSSLLPFFPSSMHIQSLQMMCLPSLSPNCLSSPPFPID